MNIAKIIYIILTLSIVVSAGGCATMPSFMNRAYDAQKTACQADFDKEYIKAGIFTLTTYQRFKASSEKIRIYIEGDGRAWETKHRLSDDPTPSNPVALALAISDLSDAVVYIARPGQFSAPNSVGCDPTYWSARRFAPEVVKAFDKTIDILKEKAGAINIELIGYSGGAAIAVLVAAGRDDVTSLRTVAGNLDPKALCEYHKVSQLDGSMNPLDVAQKVVNIPQRHFVGSKDKTVPQSIAESFVEKEGGKSSECITIVDGATHKDGWCQRWKELLLMPLDHASPKN
ncbi:MAG: alpha/beta hydrolase [Candidatus Omnitrophica bacterium]|nr:alpha/beta hydrolase [Candidatus Omnitrophota bacterium]